MAKTLVLLIGATATVLALGLKQSIEEFLKESFDRSGYYSSIGLTFLIL